MKKIIFITDVFLLHLKSFGQKGVQKIVKDEKGNIVFVEFEKNSNKRKSNESKTLFREIHKMNKEEDFELSSTIKDELNFKHDKYHQTYKGIKVEGGEFIAHLQNDDIVTLNGSFLKIGNPDTKPSLNEKKALEYALLSINATKYKWEIP